MPCFLVVRSAPTRAQLSKKVLLQDGCVARTCRSLPLRMAPMLFPLRRSRPMLIVTSCRHRWREDIRHLLAFAYWLITGFLSLLLTRRQPHTNTNRPSENGCSQVENFFYPHPTLNTHTHTHPHHLNSREAISQSLGP